MRYIYRVFSICYDMSTWYSSGYLLFYKLFIRCTALVQLVCSQTYTDYKFSCSCRANLAFNRWLLGVQNCSNRSSGQRSSNRILELELGNLFLKHKSFSTTFISFTVVNVLNTQLQSTISRFLNYNYFKCIRIHMLWYVLLKLYRIFTSFLVESTTNSIAFVCYDVWTLSLLQTRSCYFNTLGLASI